MNAFTETVEKELQKQGLKKSNLVKDIGIPDSTVRSWWGRDSWPSLEVAYKVALYLGVPLEYLATGIHAEGEITQEQKELLDSYAILDEDDQEDIMAMLKLKTKRYMAADRKSITGG